jgi:hypothetical protein
MKEPAMHPWITRLAPSPTGAQHVGNARTYLIAWLAARGRASRQSAQGHTDLSIPRSMSPVMGMPRKTVATLQGKCLGAFRSQQGSAPMWRSRSPRTDDGWMNFASGSVFTLSLSKTMRRCSPSTIGKRKTTHGSGLGKIGWVVERTLSWLKGLRRMRIRYDRLGVT